MNISEEKKKIENEVNSITNNILNHANDFKICKFHLSELPNSKNWNNHPNIDPAFKKHVVKLNGYKNDCLYWFICDTTKDAIKLDNALCDYRNKKAKPEYRAVPTSNKYVNKENTIYVGVRRGNTAKNPKLTNIMGRINQHLGYYQQPKTQGLQLLHWAKELDMHITLYVVHFEENLGSLLYVLEKEVANRLIPHCGRH